MSKLLLLSLSALAVDPAGQEAPSPVAGDAAIVTPESESGVFDHARSLALAGQHEEAVRLFSRLLERDPAHADARLARGRTFAWMRRWPESEADLVVVTAAQPGYADAWSALGDLYLWSDRPAQAIAAYSRWQQLRPDAPAPLLARSRAHRASGDSAAARADLEAAASLGADPAVVAAARAALAPPRAGSPEAVAPEGHRWSVQAEIGRTGFSGNRADWEDRAVVIRRYLARTSVAVELLETQRFETDDHAWAVDVYVDAWARAYANLRYQHAPDGALFPDHSWRAELFQGVGKGWELSASVDQLRFGSQPTQIYGAGIGRYAGNLYLRARARYVSPSGSPGLTGLVRYYYAGNGSDYFEVTAGSGRGEVERLGTVARNDSSSVGLAFVRYVTPNVGFKLSASYVDDTPRESKAHITAYYRW